MTTDQKGAIAELAIQLAATKLGIDVYRPVAEGGRYDMIFDLEPCSLARAMQMGDPLEDEVLVVRCCSVPAIRRDGIETTVHTRRKRSMR